MQSCEKVRTSLEDCEVEKDIASFILDRGTGQDIPGKIITIDLVVSLLTTTRCS